MSERVSVVQAARELGCSPQAVREHMKRGIWDLGEVVTPKQKGRPANSYSYYIFRRKLDNILGKTGEEVG